MLAAILAAAAERGEDDPQVVDAWALWREASALSAWQDFFGSLERFKAAAQALE